MQNSSFLGLAVALGSGLMIGIQAAFFTLVGRAIGPARASLVLHGIAGILAGAVVLAAIALQGGEQWRISRGALLPAAIAAAMGILIVMSVSFSFQQMGIAAGIATLFLGQMLVGLIVDTLGAAGGEPIPLDLRRVLGLVVMAVAIALLAPRR